VDLSRDAADSDDTVMAASILEPGSLAIDGTHTLRITLADSSAGDIEIDPVAFVLNAEGEVSADSDMVFYGQPDHPSRAVVLAADEAGAATALHLNPSAIPNGAAQVLIVTQVSGDGGGGASSLNAHVTDVTNGHAYGSVQLPAPGPGGLVQVGALQRSAAGWSLELQPDPLPMELGELAQAAGVSVD
jgi:stress response protein SCP2